MTTSTFRSRITAEKTMASATEEKKSTLDANETYRFVLASNPKGMPKEDDWKLETVDKASLQLEKGQLLLRPRYISVDPYLRGGLNSAKPGTVQTSIQLAEVVDSQNDRFAKGDFVMGSALPWQTLHKSDGTGLFKLDMKLVPDLSCYLGPMGMVGQTAYFGLKEICKLKNGETVLVTGAAGAVGSMVVQLAKLQGCFVIATASTSKVQTVLDLGADVCLDYTQYKTAAEARAALSQSLAGREINVYFDNTGGPITEAVWPLLARGARVGVCGQISMYNSSDKLPLVESFLHLLIYKQINIRGFLVSEFLPHGLPEFYKAISPLVLDGKLKYHETVIDGFARLPEAFIGLFEGKNTGKMLVKM